MNRDAVKVRLRAGEGFALTRDLPACDEVDARAGVAPLACREAHDAAVGKARGGRCGVVGRRRDRGPPECVERVQGHEELRASGCRRALRASQRERQHKRHRGSDQRGDAERRAWMQRGHALRTRDARGLCA